MPFATCLLVPAAASVPIPSLPAPGAHTQLQEDLVQHLDGLHAGGLGFLGQVLGLGVEP